MLKRVEVIKSISAFILVLLFAVSAQGQYRELVYYQIPVGQIKYFRTGENVTFRLKSENKFDIREGIISILSDTLYEIGNFRFPSSNLDWISSAISKKQRRLKIFSGSLMLAGGFAIVAYGISKFPSDDVKKRNVEEYHKENLDAVTIALAGLAMAAISIPIYQVHPKRYSVSKSWRVKYQ